MITMDQVQSVGMLYFHQLLSQYPMTEDPTYVFFWRNPHAYLPTDCTIFFKFFVACTYTYEIHEHRKYMKIYFENIQTILVIVMNVNIGTDTQDLNLCFIRCM